MSIGLYGGPDKYQSLEERYYDILKGLYFDNEHLIKVIKIRQAKTEEEALVIYRRNIDLAPILHNSCDIYEKEEIILATEKLKKILEDRGVNYPAMEQTEEQEKENLRKIMENGH